MKKNIFHAFLLIILCIKSALANNVAPVSGFASEFLSGKLLANATITILETGQQIKTDTNGRFGPIQYPVGKSITLEFKKWGYKTTQSATIMVPPEGLNGLYNNISFQIPSMLTYYLFSFIIGAKLDKNSCHLATTVLAYHKTMHDIPQGEVNAKITLTPKSDEQPFYFGIFESGRFEDKTNPFTKGLKSTSLDGGVLIFNLPPSDKPYTLSAEKPGVIFSKVQFLCRKGAFINISPPQGPMALLTRDL